MILAGSKGLRFKSLARFEYVVLIAALLVGVTMRVSIANDQPNLTGDAGSRYDPLARNLAAGNGFSSDLTVTHKPDDFDQPGYPAIVAAIYAITSGSTRAVVVAQIFLEGLILLLLVCVASALKCSRRTVLLSLSMALVSPVLPIFTGRILTEVTATLVGLFTCYALIRAIHSAAPVRWWVFAGLGTGGCLLIRPDMLTALGLMFVAAVALTWNGNWRGAIVGVGLYLSVIALVMLPWTLRNYATFGAVRPLGRVTEQLGNGYVKWLDTWLDDPKFLQPFVFKVLDAAQSAPFPESKVPDAEERLRAQIAIDLVRQRVLVAGDESRTVSSIVGSAFDGEPSQEFSRLADEARRRHPLKTYVVVPLRRCLMTILRMPTFVQSIALKIAAYIIWLLVLALASVGILRLALRKRTLMLVPLALIAGRLLLPLVTGIGVDPRYLVEALPAFFLFGAAGLSFLVSLFGDSRLAAKRAVSALPELWVAERG